MKRFSTFLPSTDFVWQRASWLLIVAFVLFALVVDKVASTVYGVLFLAGLWFSLRRRAVVNDGYHWLLAAFALYFIVGVAAFFLGEQTRLGEKLLGRDIRFLAAIPVFFAILAIRLPAKALMACIGVGGVVTGAAALLEVAVAGWDTRAAGESISILFGHLAAALVVVNLALALHETGRMRWLNAAGTLCALAAVLMSGTRGAALAMIVTSALLVGGWSGMNLRRLLPGLLGVVMFVIGMTFTTTGRNLVDRVEAGVAQVEQHGKLKQHLTQQPPVRLPACFGTARLLEWMVSNGILNAQPGIEIDVVEGEAFRHMEDVRCATDAFLRIRNTTSRSAGMILPERSVDPLNDPGAMIAARGSGVLRIAGDLESARRFHSRRPQVFALKPATAETDQYVVLLRAGRQADLVLIAAAPGEYQFLNASGPIVSRLHMWEAALEGFSAAPLLGRGTGAYPELLRERAEAGRGPWQITQYDHAHNEFLTVAVDRGLFGILALLLLYAVPLRLFHRRRDAFGIAGMALVATFFLSGLTETIFNHSLAITYYCVLVILLFTAPGVRAMPVQSTN